jgi:ATP-dependent DNA ligase
METTAAPASIGDPPWDLPVTPPIAPMLASPAGDVLPDRDGLAFEPKWDGFRMLAFRCGPRIALQGRGGDDLSYAFPELVASLRDALPERAVLDGEAIILRGGTLDFPALGNRLRPRTDANTISRLASESPATYVAFDALALEDRSLLDAPYRLRREALKSLGSPRAGFALTPMTLDRDVALRWFHDFEGGGLDGLMAKPVDAPYSPGKRTLLKIKHRRTLDAVVAGWRGHAKDPDRVGSLLLGLYDGRGLLQHVGAASGFSAPRGREIAEYVAPYALAEGSDHPWTGDADDGVALRRPGAANRWNRGRDQAWHPLRPEIVAEVAYDQFEGDRLRHVATWLRWRPDRDASSCTYSQVAYPTPVDIEALLS